METVRERASYKNKKKKKNPSVNRFNNTTARPIATISAPETLQPRDI
jgi:hypothetical protein